jgi:hypothetical protein
LGEHRQRVRGGVSRYVEPPDTHGDANRNTNGYRDRDAHGHTDCHAYGNADRDIHGDTNSNTHAHADCDTHGNADCDTHGNADCDTYGHTDRDADPRARGDSSTFCWRSWTGIPQYSPDAEEAESKSDELKFTSASSSRRGLVVACAVPRADEWGGQRHSADPGTLAGPSRL